MQQVVLYFTSKDTAIPMDASSAHRYLNTYGMATTSSSPPFDARVSMFYDDIANWTSACERCKCAPVAMACRCSHVSQHISALLRSCATVFGTVLGDVGANMGAYLSS